MENLKSKRYLTRKEAAELLKVTPQTISNYIDRGVIVEANNSSAVNAKRILTESVIKLLDEHFDTIQQTRAIEKLKEDLEKQKELCKEEKKKLDTTFELIKVKDFYLKNLKKVTELLAAILAKENTLSFRERNILNDIIINRDEAYMYKRYGIKQERIRQIFVRSIRVLTHKKHIPYAELKKENDELRDELSREEEKINALENRLDKLEKELDFRSIEEPTTLDSNNTNALRIPASLIGLQGISVRLYNVLRILDISNIYELTLLSRKDIMLMRNIGRKTLDELDKLLKKHNLWYNKESLIEKCRDSIESKFITVPHYVLDNKQDQLKSYLKR